MLTFYFIFILNIIQKIKSQISYGCYQNFKDDLNSQECDIYNLKRKCNNNYQFNQDLRMCESSLCSSGFYYENDIKQCQPICHSTEYEDKEH